nr:L524 [uncultured bacterium]
MHSQAASPFWQSGQRQRRMLCTAWQLQAAQGDFSQLVKRAYILRKIQ